MLLKWYVQAKTWADSDEGATAVEYGIMVAAIAVAVIVVVFAVGVKLDALFDVVDSNLAAHP